MWYINMKKVLAAFALCSLFISQANAALIFEDDFGAGSNQGVISGDFGNWTVNSGNIDLWNFGGAFNPGYAVDMNGSRALGSIQTQSEFNLLAGTNYALSFLLGNNQHVADNGLEFGLMNDDGILAFDVISDVRSLLAGLQTSSTVVTLYFSPDADVNASIFFTSTGTADFGAAIIDNVTLVPEPATLGIFALGMLGLASRRFKK